MGPAERRGHVTCCSEQQIRLCKIWVFATGPAAVDKQSGSSGGFVEARKVIPRGRRRSCGCSLKACEVGNALVLSSEIESMFGLELSFAEAVACSERPLLLALFGEVLLLKAQLHSKKRKEEVDAHPQILSEPYTSRTEPRAISLTFIFKVDDASLASISIR